MRLFILAGLLAACGSSDRDQLNRIGTLTLTVSLDTAGLGNAPDVLDMVYRSSFVGTFRMGVFDRFPPGDFADSVMTGGASVRFFATRLLHLDRPQVLDVTQLAVDRPLWIFAVWLPALGRQPEPGLLVSTDAIYSAGLCQGAANAGCAAYESGRGIPQILLTEVSPTGTASLRLNRTLIGR